MTGYRGGSRIDGRGVLVRLASRVWGHAPPRKILDFRSSEIAFVSVIASYIL